MVVFWRRGRTRCRRPSAPPQPTTACAGVLCTPVLLARPLVISQRYHEFSFAHLTNNADQGPPVFPPGAAPLLPPFELETLRCRWRPSRPLQARALAPAPLRSARLPVRLSRIAGPKKPSPCATNRPGRLGAGVQVQMVGSLAVQTLACLASPAPRIRARGAVPPLPAPASRSRLVRPAHVGASPTGQRLLPSLSARAAAARPSPAPLSPRGRAVSGAGVREVSHPALNPNAGTFWLRPLRARAPPGPAVGFGCSHRLAGRPAPARARARCPPF
jgi:hypothetical protein